MTPYSQSWKASFVKLEQVIGAIDALYADASIDRLVLREYLERIHNHIDDLTDAMEEAALSPTATDT